MMFKTIFTKSLYDKRWALLSWSVGIVALMSFAIAYYPAVSGDNQEVLQSFSRSVPSSLQAVAGRDFSLTGIDGYLQGNMLGLAAPMLILIFSISLGVSFLASEEDRGSLSVLLARPVSRSRLFLEKLLAMWVLVFIATVVMWATTQLTVVAINEHLNLARSLAAFFNVWLLGVLFGTLALSAGAVLGSKTLSTGIPAGIAAFMYFSYTFSIGFEQVKLLRYASWWYYYAEGQVLLHGFNSRDMAVLFISLVVLVAVGIWGFSRRDLNG
jgi:ABC-2 type transport system permease protein